MCVMSSAPPSGDRCMPRDVADRARLPRQRKASPATAIPTAEEVGAVIRATDDQFSAFIGVRVRGPAPW
jgi:hypothetical protein